MNGEQGIRLAAAFARRTVKDSNSSLCTVCVDVLAVSGAGITIMGGRLTGPVCVSSEHVSALEDLQFTLGEGPCQDAFRNGVAVHTPHLDREALRKWPAFINEARATGIGAVFAYPLVTGRSKIGVLTLYQDAPGDLTVSQSEDSLALADVLSRTVLDMQANSPPGMLPAELDEAFAHRAEVHQASGMVAIQLQVPIPEALAAIRAPAFAEGRSVGRVAADIVARKLRLSDVPDGTDHGRDQ